MPRSCSALFCSERHSKKLGLTFHIFPKDVNKRKKWIVNMRRLNTKGKLWQPTLYSYLCSKHFKDEMFDRTGQTCRLRQNAIPTEFNFPRHLLPKPKIERRKIVYYKPLPTPDSKQENFPKINLNLIQLEHSYGLPSIEVLRKKLCAAEEDRDNLRRQLYNTVKREKRSKAICRKITAELSSQRLIEEEVQIELDSNPIDFASKKKERLICIVPKLKNICANATARKADLLTN